MPPAVAEKRGLLDDQEKTTILAALKQMGIDIRYLGNLELSSLRIFHKLEVERRRARQKAQMKGSTSPFPKAA